MRQLVILALLAASACGKAPNSAEKARADARDVALVEAAQDAAPPLSTLSPEAMSPGDIQRSSPGCTFRPEGEADFVVLATADVALIKSDGALRVHAADKGSASLPFGTWSRYEGKAHFIDLQIMGGEGEHPSAGDVWPGRLTIRDSYDRVVYSAPGTVRCRGGTSGNHSP